jgi:DNA-binding TFAR19-related protein (PDSD5 family)
MPQDTWQTHQEWIRRQCASDWQQFEEQFGGDTPLHEALDLFYRVAQLPVDDPDLNGFWEQLLTAVEGYRQASDPDKRISCLRDLAVAAETCLKRIVKLAAPETYATLGRPAEPGRPPREPMFTDLLNFPGLGLTTDASRRIYCDFAWRARNIRNKLSHATPELSELEVARAFVDFWLTMLWATVKYKRELESLLFVLPRKSHLEKLVQRWQEHIRRWVLLDAEKLPADDESGLAELTAAELPAENAQDDLADEQEDETGKEDEEEAEERVASLPKLRRGKVHDLFEQVGRLILIADAGAGKTTSLQHYAYLQARSLLDNPRQFRPVPIYVELRYYRPEGGLWHLLRKALGSNGSQVDGGFEQFRREIAEGKWILLLDGLNEVQGDLQEQALRELEQLIGDYPQARLVITSRWDVRLRRLRLLVFQLHSLTDEQREEFLRRHFPNRREADRFIQTLRRDRRLWDWGRNPLQLWMLVQVGLMPGGGLPENRGQLLRQFVEYLLQREESKGPQIPRDIKLDLLSELGYQTRQSGRVSFPRSQAWQIVRQRSQDMGYGVDSARFVREVCDNHLLADQGEQLAFAHEMYQEYFAACGLKWRYEADPQMVEPLRGQPQWREPLVLLYGLLQNPDNLFQWLVRNWPAVAAECLLSSVRKRPTELQELRRRVREVNYAQARNVELGELLKAIYVLGDGTLLAEHLRQRQAHGRLKGIARQISQAFTGDEPAVRATLVALERLGKSATAFSQPLLQPLQSRDLKISAGLQKQAAQLWLTWRYEYQFRIFHLILLASGLGLQNLLADEIRQLIGSLLEQRQWVSALWVIQGFGLQPEAFMEAAAEQVRQLLDQGQWNQAVLGIQVFGLPQEVYAEAAAAEVRRLLEKGHWDSALRRIRAFRLQKKAFAEAVAAQVMQLLDQGQWKAALRAIRAFGLQREAFAEAAAAGIRRLLERQQWKVALQAVKAFGLATCYPPEPIIQKLLQQGQWQASLRGIQAFGLRREAFAEAAAAGVQRLLEQERWDKALQGIQAFGLTTRYPPEPIIQKLLQQGRWQASLRGIQAFGLRREAFAEAAAAGVQRLLEQERWVEALQGIQAFGLTTRYPPEPIIQKLLQQGQWQAALRGIQEFGLQREAFGEAAAAGVQRLLEQERWDEALQGIQAFGLAARYPPEPIIEKLVQQGQWQTALRRIEAFGLQTEAFVEAAAAGVWRLLEQEKWGAAVQGIQAFGLAPELSAEMALAIVGRFLVRGCGRELLRVLSDWTSGTFYISTYMSTSRIEFMRAEKRESDAWTG